MPAPQKGSFIFQPPGRLNHKMQLLSWLPNNVQKRKHWGYRFMVVLKDFSYTKHIFWVGVLQWPLYMFKKHHLRNTLLRNRLRGNSLWPFLDGENVTLSEVKWPPTFGDKKDTNWIVWMMGKCQPWMKMMYLVYIKSCVFPLLCYLDLFGWWLFTDCTMVNHHQNTIGPLGNISWFVQLPRALSNSTPKNSTEPFSLRIPYKLLTLSKTSWRIPKMMVFQMYLL